jgi:hypothetical protein
MTKGLSLLVALGTLGCFDVQQIDPCAAEGPFLVDDFEDDDAIATPPFQIWSCRGFNPDDVSEEAVNACDRTTREDGSGAFMGDFTLTDMLNGTQEFTGASLRTSATRTFDLACYRAIELSAKFVPGNPPPPGRFYVELTCESATSKGDRGQYSVLTEIQLTPSWLDFRISLSSEFRQPTWQADTIDGGPQACLERVDGVGLLLSTNLADGETGGGTLFIDDVSFE